VTQTNDTAPLTAEAFVASLPAQAHHLCMGLGRRAPKGELGVSKDDGTDADPEILAQFQSLSRAQVWIAALAAAELTPAVRNGELGLGTSMGTTPDADTFEYWVTNLPDDFRAEIVQEWQTRGAYFVALG
jgi:hypothetical protein